MNERYIIFKSLLFSFFLLIVLFDSSLLAGQGKSEISEVQKNNVFISNAEENEGAVFGEEEESSWENFTLKINDLNTQINNYQLDLGAWEIENNDLFEEIKSYFRVVSIYKEDTIDYENDRSKSENKVEKHNESFRSIQERLLVLSHDYSAYEKERTINQMKVDESDKVLAEYKISEGLYESDLKGYEQVLDHYNDRFSVYENEQEQYEKSSREMRTTVWYNRISSWESNLSNQKAQLEREKRELDQLNGKLQARLSKIMAERKKIDYETARLNTVLKDLNFRRTDLEVKMKELNNHKKYLEENIEFLLSQKGVLDKNKSDLDEWIVEIGSTWEDLEKRRVILNDRRSEILHLRTDLEDFYKKLSQHAVRSDSTVFQRPFESTLEIPETLREYKDALPAK